MPESIDAVVRNPEDNIFEIRQSIRNFCTKVRAAVIDGSIELGELYSRYEAMHPTLHKHCADEVLDINALVYALQRLPSDEIAKVKSVYIQNNPEDLSNVPGIKALQSKARRRTRQPSTCLRTSRNATGISRPASSAPST